MRIYSDRIGKSKHAVWLQQDISCIGIANSSAKDVGAGITEDKFLFCLGAEGVFGVFGFPPGAWEIEGVNEGSVDAEGGFFAAGDGVFGNHGPVELAGTFFQEVFEGPADVAFVIEAGVTEASQGLVIGLNGSKVRF